MNLIPKACFFTGHRIIPANKRNIIKSLLRQEILNKINDGVTVFISGGALGFDTLAAEQVIDMRGDYDMIHLCLYLPCHNHDISWNPSDRQRFYDIKSSADEIYYVTKNDYAPGCMKKRNNAMVEASDCGIAYMTKASSGSAQTVRMAMEKGIDVINIADINYDEIYSDENFFQ